MSEENENRERDTVGDIIDELTGADGRAQDPVEVKMLAESVVSINDFPPYIDEAENPNILIKGRWLERGGSAWWVSTAGTGKSVASVQLAYRWGAGLEFAGLTPHRPISTWIIQSEDSESRITIDREDITAELAEQTPEVDWKVVGAKAVRFVKMSGKIGPAFLKHLDELLSLAEKCGQKPDVVQLNPFMAFIGGPVTDGGYVTPFLRGGDIGHEHTDGLQALLEKHGVAALIFHHTPKPPTDNELKGWLTSAFPEYQGAGSSDITNWGRSFITMMRVPDHSRVMCLLAGKNGHEIGWEYIGGHPRRYIAWSEGVGITGGNRHAWRELNDEEYAEIVEKQKKVVEEDINAIAYKIAETLKEEATRINDIEAKFRGQWRREAVREAKRMIVNNPDKFKLTIKQKFVGNNWINYVGLVDGIEELAKIEQQKIDVAKILAENKEKEKDAKRREREKGRGKKDEFYVPF